MKLKVPASTTNFGSGFDTFGLALDIYNTFEFEPSDSYSVHVEGYGKDLPRDESNLVIKVYRRACEVFGLEEVPFTLRQVNEVPTARGLGSSATAIVGGVEICCAIHGKDIPLEEKIKVAFEFEPHPDNIVPAFVGGFVICVGDGTQFVRMDFPSDLVLVFAVPDFEVPTERSRSVVRNLVTLEDCVFNLRRASLLVFALIRGRYDLIRTAVEDRIHQPFRSGFVPGFDKVKEASYREGSLGVFLSGAGPSVCSITTRDKAEAVGEIMRKTFEEVGVRVNIIVAEPSAKGAYLV